MTATQFAERIADGFIRFHKAMNRAGAEMERDFVRVMVRSFQLEARLRNRTKYGGKKGRRAARRLLELGYEKRDAASRGGTT